MLFKVFNALYSVFFIKFQLHYTQYFSCNPKFFKQLK